MHEKEAKSILSPQNGMNIYRGCTHGCIYCDSRSTCYRMKFDFEDVEVKTNAPMLLEKTLRTKRRRCMISTGSMSDPYMPLEKELGLTRKCLELIRYYGYGLSIQTKSDLVLRDLDLLKGINEKAKCIVQMTMTTYDENLCKVLEPNVCTTKRRAEVLNILREEGIQTIVWTTPILPFINDTEENLYGLLSYCKEAKPYGIIYGNMGLTLRNGDRQYYYKKLLEYFPGLITKYMDLYGEEYDVLPENSEKLRAILKEECDKNGILCDQEKLFTYMRAFEDKLAGKQMEMRFDANMAWY